MTKIIELLLVVAVLSIGVLSIGYLAQHSHNAKIGIERHLLGK